MMRTAKGGNQDNEECHGRKMELLADIESERRTDNSCAPDPELVSVKVIPRLSEDRSERVRERERERRNFPSLAE